MHKYVEKGYLNTFNVFLINIITEYHSSIKFISHTVIFHRYFLSSLFAVCTAFMCLSHKYEYITHKHAMIS